MLDTKLYSLIKVAELGNYTRAAESLGFTQPAVSQHIKLLEEEYGIRIFGRVGQKLVITREGERLLQAAKSMLAIHNNLLSEFSERDHGTRDLCIGITHTMESNLIASVITRYAIENDVTVKLITDTLAGLSSRIKNYEIDAAVVDGSVADPELSSTTLDTDSLMLITAPEHRFSSKNMVSIEDIKSERLILRLPSSGTSNMFKASLQSRGIDLGEFNIILEVDNIATIKDMIRLNYGVSVLAKSACADELRKGKLAALPIEDMSMLRELNIIYSKSFQYKNFITSVERLYAETNK